MAWCYTIQATSGQRLLMRIAQIFDQQFLIPHDLTWKCSDTSEVEITLRVTCEEPLARRVHAKLYHLNDLHHVDLTEHQ